MHFRQAEPTKNINIIKPILTYLLIALVFFPYTNTLKIIFPEYILMQILECYICIVYINILIVGLAVNVE